MKPIQLTMCAFGPYKGKEVIDFRELQGNRLFVISGATGAGKTTIFDGISFALYGNGSGTDRKENKTLRSDFADDKLNTAVELLFEVNHKTYRIMRQLGHVKEGNKTATGEAYEFMEVLADGSEVKAVERQRVTDINTRIEEIIGLTYDQFNQIIMLPQGEFRKLLTSTSENKEAILRKIFKTERYGEMAKKLEEKKQQAQQQTKRAADLKESYFEQISGVLPARESALFELLAGNANIYQVQQALAEELLFYQQQVLDQELQYKAAFAEHDAKKTTFIEQQNLNARIEAFEQKKQQLEQKQDQLPIYEAKLTEAETAVKANHLETYNARCLTLKQDVDSKTNELEQVTANLQQATQQLEIAQVTFDVEKAKQPEREHAAQTVVELTKLKPVYEEIDQQQRVVNQLQQQVNHASQTTQQLTATVDEQKQQMARIAANVEQMQQQTLALPSLLERQQFLKEATTVIGKAQQLTKKVAELTTQQEQAKQLFEEANVNYKEQEAKWFGNQAFHLAKQLTPGCECPVCGSIDHPGADLTEAEVVDEVMLDQLKQRRDQAEQQKATLTAQLEVTEQEMASVRTNLSELTIEVSQAADLQQQYQHTMAQIEQLQAQSQQLVTQQQQLKQFQQTIEQTQHDKQKAEQNYHEFNMQFVQQQTLLEQKQSTIPQQLANLAQLTTALNAAEMLKQQLQQAWELAQTSLEQVRINMTKLEQAVKFTTEGKADFEARLADAKSTFLEEMDKAGFISYQAFTQAKRSELQIEQLKQQHLQFTNELHALKTIVEQEVVQLQGKGKVDLTAAEQQLQWLKSQYEQALHTLNASRECEKNCIDYGDKLEAVAEQIQQLEKISHEIIDLYNVLKGNNTKKVSFERFVQISYLEQITEAANMHLYNLSNGQYRLTCSERQESHGRQSGLALDVYDSYTGQDRDVKTLSGGEKFNASLCLALGMADVIQSFQGNVRIDTMFIDEGFGTLDEESLMRAIDILIELQKSGRMIGVISHVAELKAAMPAILHVIKTKSGHSETKIEVK